MKTKNLIRWSGLSAVVAGGLSVLDGIFQPLPWLTTLAVVATVFALSGIFAAQAEASGRLGLAGYLLGTAGYVFMAAGPSQLGGVPSYFVGAGLAAIGWVLLALGSLPTRVFPRWVPGLWLAAVAIGLPGLLVPSLGRSLGILGAVAVGLGLAGAGYVLWNRGIRLAAARTSAAPG